MTTASELLPPPAETSTARRSRTALRFAAAFLLSVLACAALVTAALLTYDSTNQGRILPGVRIGDTDLSGLEPQQARLVLAAAYSGYREGRVVLHTVAGDVHVPYRAFSRQADVEAMVATALATGRSGGPLERAFDEVRIALHGVQLQPQVTLDDEALAGAVDEALRRLELEPVDATVGFGPVGLEVSVARDGRAFDLAAARDAVLGAVQDPAAGPEVDVDASAISVPPAVGDADVMAAVDAAQRLIGDVVVTDGSRDWTIPAATVRSWLHFESRDGSFAPVVEEAAIPAALAGVAKDVLSKPVEASFLTGRDGRIVGVTASRDGKSLDTAKTASAVASVLAERAAGGAPGPATITTTVVHPSLTTEEARRTAPLMVRLSSWKTWFPIGERNANGANIWLPAMLINGTVLDPGERFEWWRAIGPVTAARGFGMGGYIAGDHTDPTGALGGGMCSSSTTLFNAALRAGLQMGARSNHQYYINRYPLGLDATVSMYRGRVSQTVTFTNDMKTPILIRGYKIRGSGGKGWVQYEIWGVPDGRQVSISKAFVTNLRRATTKPVYVSTLPRGVRKQTEWPSNGMDVSVTRVVRDAGGRVIHNETYRSHYVLWNGRIEIGR